MIAHVILNRRRPRASAGTGLPNGSYSTAFTTVENPLSEGGVWLNGRTDALDANNMNVSVAGKCWGRQNLDAGTTGTTRDGTAVLKGSFTANQFAQGTVYVDSLTGTAFPECELLLRHTCTAHSITGYEIGFSCKNDGTAYMFVVIWYGPIAQGQGVSYDYLLDDETHPATNQVVTGDVIRAEIVGNIITVKKNGSTLATVDITTNGTVFSSGNPGLGHNSEDTDGSSNSQYGFTAFSAGNL